MTTLGPSLGARFAVSAAKKSAGLKKKWPRNHTLSAATIQPVGDAVGRLANKLNKPRSRVIEMAVMDFCEKHGITIDLELPDE